MSLRLPRPYSFSELGRLFRAAKKAPYPVPTAAVMRFLMETGLRSDEALSITRAEAASWRYRRDVSVRLIGKGDKERIVSLSPTALRAARTLVNNRPKKKPGVGGTVNSIRAMRDGYMIPWGDRGLRWVLREVGKRAGVDCQAHRFRHTWITQLCEAGNPIEVVADMAGHANIQTTRLYYMASERRRYEAMQKREHYMIGNGAER